MEIILIILISILIILISFLIWKTQGSGAGKEHLESVLNSKFIDFSEKIRSTMDSTRKEVEQSKDVLSQNALNTLKEIGRVNTTISSLVQQQEKAQQLGQSLEYLLQAPKLRGNYGETILEEMLEKILPNKMMWEKQYSIDGREKVDAVVKYKDVIVPIDSKFPKDDYQKYLSSKDNNEKKTNWSNYEKALKVQINSIKDKYIKPEKGTTEFALLFIPSEAIYYETIAEKNYFGDPCEIYEYATSRKVIPVSPNTFYAFLEVIIMGVRNIEIAREAKKLQEALSGLEKDFGLFYNNFELIGKTLIRASDAFRVGDGHVKRFKKNLDSTIQLDEKLEGKAEGLEDRSQRPDVRD